MKTVRFICLLCACWHWALTSRAQDQDLNLVRLTVPGVDSDTMQRLGRGESWRFRPGTPEGWASPTTDDRTWLLTTAVFTFGEGPPGWGGTGCFRLRFTLDSALVNRPLALRVLQQGGIEFYLDGHWLGSYGKAGPSAATTQHQRVRFRPLVFMCTTAGPHLLAIRYAKFDPWPPPHGGFALWVATAERRLVESETQVRLGDLNLIAITGTAVLALLHGFLFLFYPQQRANLYYSLYMALASATSLMVYLRWVAADITAHWWASLGFQFCWMLCFTMLLAFVYSVCQTALSKRWLALATAGPAALIIVGLLRPAWDLLPVWQGLFMVLGLDMFRVMIRAMRQHQPGIWLVALGTFGTLLVPFIASGLFGLWGGQFAATQQLVLQLCLLLLPICMSVYLARDFATTHRHLEMQLHQVQALSAQTRQQEAERQQLIRAQNEVLENTVQTRTEEIRHQNTVLATQKAEISEQAERLRELDEVKSRFFTNITHEFRTPLTLLLGPAEQILAESQEPATRQHVRLMQRNAHRLLHLINQLLDLSKLEAGHLELSPVSDDLVRFVRGLFGSFESLAQQQGITTSFTINQAELVTDFDPDKLEKIVYNLLSNAFKFTPRGGHVSLSVQQVEAAPATAAWIELEVGDTGRGIAAGQQARLFDRFYQADSSDTREQEGTGIGLALTKELVELHGGTITLVSELGHGTTVTVRLPVRQQAASAGTPRVLPLMDMAPLELLPVASPAEATQVLVIEDNADVRAFLRTTLAAHYQVLEAVHGEEGVELAREQVPDLVLTDVMMPRLDGYGVCQALRTDERTSHIPVVMLTAKAGVDSKLEGLHTGADAYLVKPFHTAELLATLDNLLRSRQLLRESYRRGYVVSASAGLPSMEQAFIARVEQVVAQYLADETFSVETLGREVGLSRTQLHRKLKAVLNQAPGDFIRLVRLQRAQELLAANVGTVAEVAYLVGFSNPSTFSTSFSRHFGYAPARGATKPAPPGEAG
ncbi:ATP-binding protein [Hymenobacter volaticus]|uniref:histidine kinase n=1 Tax=Hymenobacter volaticus TaxID=2932254 RepID=A0ABY4GDP7_9BACT|nr:ATP-binding protein [Hymenobacter volaticus]UOQ69008.1 ATP-binding protein [Hymenobacter volaticus]